MARKNDKDISLTNKEVYPSMKAVAQAKGVTIAQLKAAKNLMAPGFHQSGRIIWDLLSPYMTQHIDEINDEVLNQTSSDAQQKTWMDERIKNMQLKNRILEENMFTREDVETVLITASSQFNIKLLQWFPEFIAPKVVGKSMEEVSEIVKNELTKIIATIKDTKVVKKQ